MGQVPRWWLVYCEPGTKWLADDIETVLSEFEKKPPNRQLLSPVLGAYIAGLLQASGVLGYLQISREPMLYTPFVKFECDLETADFLARQLGDCWGIVRGKKAVIYVLGLRCVVLLKIIGPYLRGFKKFAYDMIITYGYKLVGSDPKTLAKNYNLRGISSAVTFEGKKINRIVMVGKV